MNKSFLKGSIALLPLLLLLFSCTDDKLQAGIEILPDSDQLEARADTLALRCFTYKGLTGNAFSTPTSTGSYPIGEVIDDIFGKTSSEVAVELIFDKDNYYGNDSVAIGDTALSLKLYLDISGLDAYGDENAFNVKVLPFNRRYSYNGRTNQAPTSDLYDSQNSIASETVENISLISDEIIAPLDSGNYLVITLNNEIAAKLLDSTIYNKDDFTEFFKTFPGFSIKAQSIGAGGLQNFYPDKSKLILEYKRPGIALNGNDTILYSSFDFSEFQFTYRHNHSTTGAEIEKPFRDTTKQFSHFYLQGLGGTRGIIKFESLKTFKEKYGNKVGINLAELVIPISKGDYLEDISRFPLPKRISVQGLMPELVTLPDDFNAYYFNGYLDEDNLVYRVNLSEYVNKYMLGYLDFILLNVTTAQYTPSDNTAPEYQTPARVVLNAGEEVNDDPAYIRIIYTLIYN